MAQLSSSSGSRFSSTLPLVFLLLVVHLLLGLNFSRAQLNRSSLKSCLTGCPLLSADSLWSTTRHRTHSLASHECAQTNIIHAMPYHWTRVTRVKLSPVSSLVSSPIPSLWSSVFGNSGLQHPVSSEPYTRTSVQPLKSHTLLHRGLENLYPSLFLLFSQYLFPHLANSSLILTSIFDFWASIEIRSCHTRMNSIQLVSFYFYPPLYPLLPSIKIIIIIFIFISSFVSKIFYL